MVATDKPVGEKIGDTEDIQSQSVDFRIKWAAEMRKDGLPWNQIEDATQLTTKRIRRGARRLGLTLPRVGPPSKQQAPARKRSSLLRSTHEGNLIPAIHQGFSSHLETLREMMEKEDEIIAAARERRIKIEAEYALVSAALGVIE